MNKNIPDEMASAVTELSTELTAFDAEQSAAWREANKQRLEKMEETIQENIVLRRLLLSLRNSTEPNKENQSLLKQIDEQLKIRVLPK